MDKNKLARFCSVSHFSKLLIIPYCGRYMLSSWFKYDKNSKRKYHERTKPLYKLISQIHFSFVTMFGDKFSSSGAVTFDYILFIAIAISTYTGLCSQAYDNLRFSCMKKNYQARVELIYLNKRLRNLSLKPSLSYDVVILRNLGIVEIKVYLDYSFDKHPNVVRIN
jgi:hypothetical protein